MERLTKDLASVEAQRNRVVEAIADGIITKAQSRKQVDKLNERETLFGQELVKLQEELRVLPTLEDIENTAKQVSAKFRKREYADGCQAAWTRHVNSHPQEMTWEEKRSLALMVFGGKGPDGKRLGVYIEWVDGQENRRRKKWKYTITGRLIRCEGVIPNSAAESLYSEPSISGHLQGQLLNEVRSSASR